MPIHEYVCGCGEKFEKYRMFGEDVGQSHCEKCGGQALKDWTRVPTVRQDIQPHYCEQLDANIGSRADEKKRIKEVFESSEGKINIDWH